MKSPAERNIKTSQTAVKRRRLHNACDICKQKKIRCDSATMPGKRCSNCIAFGSECTHNIASWKMKGSDSTKDAEISSLVSEIVSAPGVYIAPPNPVASRKLIIRLATYAKELELQLSSLQTRTAQTSQQTSEPSSGSSPKLDESDDEDGEIDLVSDSIKQLSLYPSTERCYGKTSYISLVQTVWHVLKQESSSSDEALDIAIYNTKRPEFWSDISPKLLGDFALTQSFRSPEFEMVMSLSELYFSALANFVAPFLHRPSFEKSVADNLHCRDPWFATLVLSVGACGSRYSDDPQTVVYGWQCLDRIQSFLTPFVEGSCCLHELQVYCNCVWFLQSPSTSRKALLLLSHAIRIAQDIGANRRRWYVDNNRTPMENESWKRTFWALVLMDDCVSEYLGRPRLLKITDYDLTLPFECDDEYFEHPDPENAFKQPVGKPAKAALFVETIKLTRIFIQTEHCLLYAPKPLSPNTWRRETLSQFDRSLRTWFENLPVHLRWSPYAEEGICSNQAATLHVIYYWAQIQMHRRFIYSPEPGQSLSPSSSSSLSVCVSAARSCAHVLDVQTQKGFIPPTYTQTALLYAATMLVLSSWWGETLDFGEEYKSGMDDVYRCITILRRCERRWAQAGQLRDIIQALLSTTKMGRPSLLKSGQKSDTPASLNEDQPPNPGSLEWSSDYSQYNWNFPDYSNSQFNFHA